jgi:hypothetical protein
MVYNPLLIITHVFRRGRPLSLFVPEKWTARSFHWQVARRGFLEPQASRAEEVQIESRVQRATGGR